MASNILSIGQSALAAAQVGISTTGHNIANAATRQSVLSSAQALAARFQSLDGRLDEIRQGVNSQITSNVDAINTYAKQISRLNSAIDKAQSSSNGQPANDLLDQRDQLVND